MEFRIKAIIEVLGKPKEHVDNTIQKVIDELKKREGIKVLSHEIAESEKVEHFFSTYADVELKLSNLDNLIDFCFDFLPSNVEILEPETLNFDSHVLAEYMNDLLAKLHQQSMIIRNLHAENLMMKGKISNKN